MFRYNEYCRYPQATCAEPDNRKQFIYTLDFVVHIKNNRQKYNGLL